MFFSVSSRGIEPICRSTIRLPTPDRLDRLLKLLAHRCWAAADHHLPVGEVLEGERLHVRVVGECLLHPVLRRRLV
jgi:hypothetical protein